MNSLSALGRNALNCDLINQRYFKLLLRYVFEIHMCYYNQAWGYLNQASLDNKGFIIWPERELFLAGQTGEIPSEQGGSVFPSRVKNQNAGFLSARRFSHIIIRVKTSKESNKPEQCTELVKYQKHIQKRSPWDLLSILYSKLVLMVSMQAFLIFTLFMD